MKHLVRDVQQQKAKHEAFNKLGENTAFWLKDFCQKILPMRYREVQRDYFGKKGISLHVDIFFTKDKEKEMPRKSIYLTCIHRCDQDVKDVLCISDNVLQRFTQENPEIKEIYKKLDNAGCYHSSLSPEALYVLCKKHDIKLKRYDFNESCRGKDQCDRESAAEKTIIRSYVNSGNGLLSAEDVYKAVLYGSGLKDAEICVLEIDPSILLLQFSAVRNHQAYQTTIHLSFSMMI